MNTKFYSCIECGAKNVALFQVFSENALTLQTCANCSKVIDKYVEYDFTVILIDILLLKFSAYRHVLYNSNTKTHLSRLLALTLLSSSYVEWVYQKGQIQQRSEFILYELEWSFYIMIGQELIKAALFSFTFMLLGFMSSMMSVYRETFSWTHMLCGMAMSYCCGRQHHGRQCSKWQCVVKMDFHLAPCYGPFFGVEPLFNLSSLKPNSTTDQLQPHISCLCLSKLCIVCDHGFGRLGSSTECRPMASTFKQ
ncbi:protein ARV1 isoform X4 [Daphnia magna]|uniref:protein ARV1-like isoform X6 n=1 Tax=Daphnia magna TaxID=35525 RepID=UPI001E1BDB4B|nr:protein ARV1-like isoform X6 [Daphnia magna]XP_045036756.1 protein ARV1 isoform X4 [Daphnia magna]